MLPPGHIAGGYLASLAAVGLLGLKIPELQIPSMTALGTFMAFAPDLDMFRGFARAGKMHNYESDANQDHRYFFTHVPIIYLLAALGLFAWGVLQDSGSFQAAAIVFLVGSWSHFILDSLESSGSGIKWFWPISNKLYSVFPKTQSSKSDKDGFWKFWIGFVKSYTKHPEFYLEVLIIIVALIVVIHP